MRKKYHCVNPSHIGNHCHQCMSYTLKSLYRVLSFKGVHHQQLQVIYGTVIVHFEIGFW